MYFSAPLDINEIEKEYYLRIIEKKLLGLLRTVTDFNSEYDIFAIVLSSVHKFNNLNFRINTVYYNSLCNAVCKLCH